MDPTGLLDAILAVAIYPGAAFLAVAALLHARLGRGGAVGATRGPLPPASLLPVLAATIASAMLPMVGAPALRLPPGGGAAGNVVVVAVLLAVAVDLGAGSRRAAWLAASATLPVLALGAAGSTVSVVTISTAGGTAASTARVVAAALLVLAASTAGSGRAAAAVAAALALAGATLVLPAVLRDAPPVACALASLGVVALSGVLARWRHLWAVSFLAAAGVGGAIVATGLAVLSSRG